MGYIDKGEFIPDVLQPYLQGQFSFVLPYKKEQLPLKEIMGDIIVHLPLSKHSSSYSDMSIGAQWEDEGVSTRIVLPGVMVCINPQTEERLGKTWGLKLPIISAESLFTL